MVMNSKSTEGMTVKDKHTFQAMLGNYDEKLYKEAIKKCDILLENYPGHTETMAFKGLITSALGNTKEGADILKKTMMMNMANMKNSTVWHIYGMI